MVPVGDASQTWWQRISLFWKVLVAIALGLGAILGVLKGVAELRERSASAEKE